MIGIPPSTIVVLEPTWAGHAHLPGNLGLMTTLSAAFPGASLHFVGDASQIALIEQDVGFNANATLTCHAWEAHEDKQPGWRDVRQRMAALQALPEAVRNSDLFVLTSMSATCVQAVARLGWAPRSLGILHGNAGELVGWRSRNPWSRQFDFTSGVNRYVAAGGRLLVLEERIRGALSARLPHLAPALRVWPHPLISSEARSMPMQPRAPGAIRVGYAGLATVDKGFPEFLELARDLQAGADDGTNFEFHAYGKLSARCAQLNQTMLSTQAGAPLPRSAFLEGLRSLDYLFVWHNEAYYGLAASGVVYDAVNQLIPLLGNRAGQQAHWTAQGHSVGLLADDLDTLKATLKRKGSALVQAGSVETHQASLQVLQNSLKTSELAALMRTLVCQRP